MKLLKNQSRKNFRTALLVATILTSSIYTGHAYANQSMSSMHQGMHQDMTQEMQHDMGEGMHHKMGSSNGHHMMRHGVDDVVPFKAIAQASRPLALPPVLKGEADESGRVVYNVTAQSGHSAIKEGAVTATYGYNGDVLGPVLLMKTNEKVRINLQNNLPEDTTFHWHGLVVRSDVDGGPHYPIKANGGTGSIEFTVQQGAGMAWYHPHNMGSTASQVYKGLAGLIIINDDKQSDLGLPQEYGVNDIPVVLQDRTFTDTNQWDYDQAYNADGVYGDTLVVNGTINPYFEVNRKLVRVRLLNGSNARNYTVALSDGSRFTKIAVDGGLLNTPVSQRKVTLVPGERAELLIDFSQYKGELPSLVTQDGAVTVLQFRAGANFANAPVEQIPTWHMNFETYKDLQSNVASINEQKADKHVVMSGMAEAVTINGKKFSMDRVDLTSKLGSTEIWDITNADNAMMGMIHPFHIHGVQFEVLTRNGKSVSPSEQGLKDTILVSPSETVRLKVKFTKPGIFMVHCHILEHEENGMMIQLEVK